MSRLPQVSAQPLVWYGIYQPVQLLSFSCRCGLRNVSSVRRAWVVYSHVVLFCFCTLVDAHACQLCCMWCAAGQQQGMQVSCGVAQCTTLTTCSTPVRAQAPPPASLAAVVCTSFVQFKTTYTRAHKLRMASCLMFSKRRSGGGGLACCLDCILLHPCVA